MKISLVFLAFFAILLASPSDALAAITVNSVTLNGSSSVTVSPSASITASITVTTSGNGATNDWSSTVWNISGANCVNHADYTNSGTFSESFTFSAPSTPGTYSVSFIGYRNDTCTAGASSTYTMTNSIIVSAPTPTPTLPPPTPTPVPTGTPVLSPTPTSSPDSTAISTSTPTDGSADASTSSTIYYPSVTLTRSGATFTGTATISNGTIEKIEYSLDNGETWSETTASDGTSDEGEESFAFTPSVPFTAGDYIVIVRAKSLAQVYTESANYASASFTVTPPSVLLNNMTENPTNDLTPTFTGTTSGEFAPVTRVEISINGGETWLAASLVLDTFSFTAQELEDGNYGIVARAFDSAGNVGVSSPQTLVVDTLPPIIGGGSFSLGPTALLPRNGNTINAITNAEISVALSMKGGVTEAKITSNEMSYSLNYQGGDLWTGKISFSRGGEKSLTVTATDGAENTSTRSFGSLYIQNAGVIQNIADSNTLDAKVSLYFFDTSSQSWTLWEAESYGQVNPAKTNESGYSFLVPAGKYYLEASAPGYHKTQSQIMILETPTILDSDIALRPKPSISFTLPVIGKVLFTIPEFLLPPDNTEVNTVHPEAVITDSLVGVEAPNLDLPNLDGSNTNLASYRGEKLLLTFLSPIFPESIEQASILSDLSDELPENINILAISLQQTLATTKVFLARGAYEFPIVFDKNGESAQYYSVSYLPKSFLVNAEGKITEVFAGVLGKTEALSKLNNMQ